MPDWLSYGLSGSAVSVNLGTGAVSGGHAAGDTLNVARAGVDQDADLLRKARFRDIVYVHGSDDPAHAPLPHVPARSILRSHEGSAPQPSVSREKRLPSGGVVTRAPCSWGAGHGGEADMRTAGYAPGGESVESVREALRACLDRPHEQAWGMPAGFYTSPEFLALEVDELFRKEWVCIGRVEEAAAPGDYWTVDLLGEPLLVVRGEDGRLKAYSNVCRHRGTPVASGRGNIGL